MPPGAPADGALDVGAVCPLCDSSLEATQDWCLRCGAAARTRLAAAPRWKALVLLLATVAVLALGVLAAALVKLAGDTGSSSAPSTPRSLATPTGTPPGASSSTPATGASSGITTPASTAPSAAPQGTAPRTAPGAAPASAAPSVGTTTGAPRAQGLATGGAGRSRETGAVRQGTLTGRTGG
jgi:hypothetical protein